MKKHINLLYKRQDHEFKQRLFRYFRRLTIIILIVTVLTLAAVNYLIFSAGQREKNLIAAKSQLLQDLLPLSSAQSKLSYINDKAAFWTSLMVSSPAYYNKYYQIVLSLLPAGAAFDSFTISNKREMTAAVSFADINAYYSFMDSVEDIKFKSQFSRLDLDRTGISDFDSIAQHPITVRLSGLVNAK